MQAIILAAGMGKRMKELTANRTKCMVEVNGVRLIDRMLRQLDGRGLTRIVIVVGYAGQDLMDHVNSLKVGTPITFVENPIYDRTNNIYSLKLAKDYLCLEDTLLFESDIIFEDAVLDELLNDPRPTLALVDKYESWMDGTCVKINTDDTISSFVPGRQFTFEEIPEYYKTVNIYKFSKDFSVHQYVPFLEAYVEALGNNEYYEQVLRVITMLDGSELRAKRLNGEKWYEIDDIQDLDIAESMFNPDEDEKLRMLQGRYGGYWRYPDMIDFCYLVNPFFPPKRMMDEIKANFEILLTQYPSGMRVNSLLAAKDFCVSRDQIVVGNGAAELIKSWMSQLKGRIGIIRPTFEEYGHRYDPEQTVVFHPDDPDFSYTAEDLIGFFGKNTVETLIVINPDNPSGNYLPKADLLKLVRWTKDRGMDLLIDESFADFADEPDNSMLDRQLLRENEHLYVMKSISKSYGVPGLRLGILASGNVKRIAEMKKDVAIWNINSFAEFYLQIEEKYKKDYVAAMDMIRSERERFINELQKNRLLRVVPSQANYLMVEIRGIISASELAKRLLIRHHLLVKDLTEKVGRQYLRIAIRNKADNDRLIYAMNSELIPIAKERI
ncbi:MAG: aminotransferase class I/II-fold pyridoxal phosphate-dependent enzyme [Clostridiales bacterium]|nr:aminotransferase class I/II-fold pyridoxal phosphate-dependent enzyme [Clostridiales bacterium]